MKDSEGFIQGAFDKTHEKKFSLEKGAFFALLNTTMHTAKILFGQAIYK